MADLSAVLRKTIDGLPGSSPELRAKVYEKARAAIERQINAANPPLAEDVALSRRNALEDAISRTEAHYLGLEGRAEAEDAAPEPEPLTPAAPVGYAAQEAESHEPAQEAQHATDTANAGHSEQKPLEPSSVDETPADDADNVIPAPDMAAPRYPATRRSASESKSRMPIYATILLALVVVGGGGYLAWTQFGDQLPGVSADSGAESETAENAATDTPVDGAEQPAVDEATAPSDTGAETPDGGQSAPVQEPGAREYTQRLLPDGSEVQEGPGSSTANIFDEGTNVAAATPAAQNTTPQPQPPAADAPALAQGERVVVFYEERFQDVPGAQYSGSVRWSAIEEPPAEGQEPESAIRAEINIPDRDLKLSMTIRRNTDETLPASHVIEMLFSVPDDFPGGDIATVQRLALKPTEQDRGRPLIGVAGQISDDFFWVALNDLEQAVNDNLSLMANEKWIDIPIAYSTGQRALLSIEKGPEGEAVFKEVLADWNARS